MLFRKLCENFTFWSAAAHLSSIYGTQVPASETAIFQWLTLAETSQPYQDQRRRQYNCTVLPFIETCLWVCDLVHCHRNLYTLSIPSFALSSSNDYFEWNMKPNVCPHKDCDSLYCFRLWTFYLYFTRIACWINCTLVPFDCNVSVGVLHCALPLFLLYYLPFLAFIVIYTI